MVLVLEDTLVDQVRPVLLKQHIHFQGDIPEILGGGAAGRVQLPALEYLTVGELSGELAMVGAVAVIIGRSEWEKWRFLEHKGKSNKKREEKMEKKSKNIND